MKTVLEDSLIDLDDVPEAYARFDSEFRCTFVNQAAQLLLDKTRETLIGNKLWDLYPGNAGAFPEEGFSRVMAERTIFTFDLHDETRHRCYAITAIADSSDSILLRFSDITNPKNDEARRQQLDSHSQLHGIATNLPGFIYQSYIRGNGEWGVSSADQRAADILGIDPEPLETVFKRFAACIAPEDQERFIASIRESTRTQKDWEFEGRFIKPTGEEKYIRGVSRARRLGDEIVHDGIVLDTTEHRRAAQALRDSDELYRQLFEVESDALLLVDKESGQILAANAAAEDLYGYSRDELVSMNRVDLSAEPEATVHATTMMQRFIPLQWHRKKDGTIFPVEISRRYFDWRGRSVFVSAIRDITDRRVMEEALRKSEEKFAKAFYSNPAAIVIGDRSTKTWLEVNDSFVRLLGYRRDELVGHGSDDFSLWADPCDRDRATRQLSKDGSLRDWEFRFRKKNGELGIGLLSVELIEIEGRSCTISSVVDITERIELERQLRQAQKLEGLGRLAGGVAHDFNNLLTVINGYSDYILSRLLSSDPSYLPLQEISKAGERATSLTKQLLAFSRKQVVEPMPMNLNTVVNDAERMLQRLIGEDIELSTSLDPLLGQILADPDQVYQVIMNLVVNARDAMPDGGRLQIITKNVDLDESTAGAHIDAVLGRHVLMVVTDTGSGMSEETMQSIFDPFFTTKEQGKGTGLGLAMVYGIIRQAGGWIEVSSKVGQGASFKIYLPRIHSIPASDQVGSPAKNALGGSENVLVVEDQEEVRRLTRTVLESYGYTVLEAANGADALRVARERSCEIDLLLTDVILPGMNGKALAEQVRVLCPNLKVIFMSGYPADVISHRGVLEQGAEYLPKPFSPESLAVKVRQVLTVRPRSR